MERRKFVIGMGALATGSAAAVGTGAFTSAQMSRDVDIDVVNDSSGLIALKAGDSDFVEESGGELGIDLSAKAGGDGVNINSKYQVGSIFDDRALTTDKNSPTTDPAFEVHNLTDSPKEIGIDFEFVGDGPNPGGSQIFFQSRPGGGDLVDSGETIDDATYTKVVNGDNTSGSLLYEGDTAVKSAGRLGVSFLVDTTKDAASVDEDLTGVLTIYAGEASSDAAE